MPAAKTSNPIVEIYRGKPIRKYNKINFRVNQYEMKKFIDLQEDNSLSVRTIMKCLFGSDCNGIEIMVFNKLGDQITIKNPFHKKVKNGQRNTGS